MYLVSIEGISKFNWILQTFGAKSFWASNTSSWTEDFSIQLTIEVTEQPPIFEDLDLLAIPELVSLSQVRKLPKVGRKGDWETKYQTDNGQTISVIQFWPMMSAAISPEGSELSQWQLGSLIFALGSKSESPPNQSNEMPHF